MHTPQPKVGEYAPLYIMAAYVFCVCCLMTGTACAIVRICFLRVRRLALRTTLLDEEGGPSNVVGSIN